MYFLSISIPFGIVFPFFDRRSTRLPKATSFLASLRREVAGECLTEGACANKKISIILPLRALLHRFAEPPPGGSLLNNIIIPQSEEFCNTPPGVFQFEELLLAIFRANIQKHEKILKIIKFTS
jgi:hypothetical protein